MKVTTRSLKGKYMIFIATVVFTIIANQLIIQYDLNQQDHDAHLINVAGRQRTIGQRIPKVLLYAKEEILYNGNVNPEILDTLNKLVDYWRDVHYKLIDQNNTHQQSPAIYALLNKNTKNLEAIVHACKDVVEHPTKPVIFKAIQDIADLEYAYLYLSERTVETYQREAEEKLAYLKKVAFILSICSLLILLFEFIFVFLPVLIKQRKDNKHLIKLNDDLVAANDGLIKSEQEIKHHLDQINTLQLTLEISEELYRETIEEVMDMIYELDPDGKFSFVNPVVESMCGLHKDQLIGRHFTEFIHPDDRNRVIKFYKEQSAKEQCESYLEFRMAGNNKDIWIGQNVRMFFYQGWLYKVSAVARDISDVKKIQNQLAEREELYRLISENSSDVIVLTDDNRKFTFVSQSVKEVLGFTAEELLHGSITTLVHPSDQVFLTEQAQLVKQKQESLPSFYFRIRHRDGFYIWVEAHTKPFYSADGKFQYTQTSMRDITKRKEAEDKLAESEKLYKLLSENMKDFITLHTLEGDYTFVSPSVEDMLGYTPEELLGRNAMEFVHPDDVANLDEVQNERLKGHETYVNPPYRFKAKNGEYIWIEELTTPVLNEHGELVCLQSTSRNITERKHFEQALMEAKDKAELATKAKSTFLSMMSHEIRTPMNAIIGLTNLLIEEGPRQDQFEHLRLLKFSGDNLLVIINDILDFSKIEADKIQLENIDFDLKGMLDSTMKMLVHRARQNNNDLVLDVDKSVPKFLKGDPVRLGQVITNLLGNALKFTNNGIVKLNVKSVEYNGYEHAIQFDVIDTGIGIPADKLSVIFESFSQAEDSTTRHFGGTGLGLAITRKLIKLMGSDIRVESEIGVGSRFFFTVRFAQGEFTNDEVEDANQTLETLLKDRGVKIMLVEDNKVNQIVAINFLQKWGIEVVVANHGREAIEKILTKEFDLVLMDLQMPMMNGYEATELIRSMEDKYFKRVPIIAMTASAMGEMRDRVLTVGMTDFMTKPFKPEDLQRVIVKHVLNMSRENMKITKASTEGTDTATTPIVKSTFLSNQLDTYTEGNADFKIELIGHFIKNLDELKAETQRSIEQDDSSVFKSIVHKMRTTISIIGNEALIDTVDSMGQVIEKNAHPEMISEELHNQFLTVCNQLIRDMQGEMATLSQQIKPVDSE